MIAEENKHEFILNVKGAIRFVKKAQRLLTEDFDKAFYQKVINFFERDLSFVQPGKKIEICVERNKP